MTRECSDRDRAGAAAAHILDAGVLRRLEWHEAQSHAHGERTVRDLGDAILLHDPVQRDPFLNRMSGLRLPVDDAAFDRRLGELLGLFASLDRRPHVSLSPRFHTPADLADRLRAIGFVETGATSAMVLQDAAAAAEIGVPRGARMERLSTAGQRRPEVIHGAARVMVEAFGADDAADRLLVGELERATTGARDVCLLLIQDEPVAVGRRFSEDGMTYLSSIGTRSAWRGRGFGAAVTAALVSDGRGAAGAGSAMVHLRVDSWNAAAQRLYRRLGFRLVGDRIADLLLR